MTYNVFGGTLSLTQSINQSELFCAVLCPAVVSSHKHIHMNGSYKYNRTHSCRLVCTEDTEMFMFKYALKTLSQT